MFIRFDFEMGRLVVVVMGTASCNTVENVKRDFAIVLGVVNLVVAVCLFSALGIPFVQFLSPG